jgi:hypothetical protein
MNIGLPKSDRPERAREDRRLVGTCIALAREHRLRCPALNHTPPQFCDLSLYDLAILLRRAGIELTRDEQHELS